ncbi:MAG: hypothetical protein QOI01_5240, partial [Mycobacterium sp.]|nr:hypothetical protein [Mycobacterium sp.]
RNTAIPLTAAGILAALIDRPIQTGTGKPGPDDTALELPSRLTIVPKALTSGTVVCRHATTPRFAGEVAGLWRTQLIASDPVAAGQIGLQAVDFDDTDPPFDIPLGHADRGRIVLQTASALAHATRLELGSLGGTLDASGRWPEDNPTFEWEHHCVLGRDMFVRTLAKGFLYPFGHRAEFLRLTIRMFDPESGGAATLRTIEVLTIVEPVRSESSDDKIRRGFPFSGVEIIPRTFTDLRSPPDWKSHRFGTTDVSNTFFWVETAAQTKVQFPIRCQTTDGEVHGTVPLLFVSDLPDLSSRTDPVLTTRLSLEYGEQPIPVPGTMIDLVGSAGGGESGDIHEVHAVTIGGVALSPDATDGYRAEVRGLSIAMPALRSLLGKDDPLHVTFADAYLDDATDVLLDIKNQTLDLNFTKQADRSGALIAPNYSANAISRTLGPVNTAAFPNPVTGDIDPTALFHPDARILGFPMQDLITDLKDAPKITCSFASGRGPDITMLWQGIKLKTNGAGFVAGPGASLDLSVTGGPSGSETNCTLGNFAFEFPPRNPVLRLTFTNVVYNQKDGQPPTMTVDLHAAEFIGDLSLIEDLKDVVDLGEAGNLIDVTPTAIALHYSLAPKPAPLSNGAFVLRNIALTARMTVPYNGDPVTIALGFSSRANPFQMSVLMFGGTGYAEIELNQHGLQRFDAGMEFGALIVVDFVIARGEVHVLGGVRFQLEADHSVTVTGYLRIGGSVEVLGLVSVSIELILSLSYSSARNALVGRATLVIEVDLTLWSDTMELDSGEWVLAGPSHPSHHLQHFANMLPGETAFDGLSQWRRYRAAFDRDTNGVVV